MAAALLCVNAAFASTTATSQTTSSGQAQAAGGGAVINESSGPVNETTRFDASSAVSPQLVASAPCMGSTSSGVQGANFGVSIGSTWKDLDCRKLSHVRELWNMGLHAAAVAEACSDADMNYDISVTGGIPYTREDGVIVHRACPMDKKAWEAAGKPLLDPISGTPMTDAELNPPVKVTIQPSLSTLSATDKQKLLNEAQASLIEVHAAAAKEAANQ